MFVRVFAVWGHKVGHPAFSENNLKGRVSVLRLAGSGNTEQERDKGYYSRGVMPSRRCHSARSRRIHMEFSLDSATSRRMFSKLSEVARKSRQ